MTPHQQSSTHKYIKGETLLRARPVAASSVASKNEFEIWRGAKVIAKVRSSAKDVVVFWGAVNKENALDAIFIYQLEQAQKERERAEGRKFVVGARAVEATKPRPQAIPQVIVTLSPDGAIQVELPAAGATRRVILLRPGEEGATLRRILEEQRSGNIAIGQDGAPTSSQVSHWEHHQDFPNPRCSFCLAEGCIKGTPKRQMRKQLISKSKDVEIRRLLPVQKRSRGEALKVTSRTHNVEDLDL